MAEAVNWHLLRLEGKAVDGDGERGAQGGSALQVQVRFGAGLAQVVGHSRTTVELAGGATLADLFDRIEDTFPAVHTGLNGVLAVVDGAHVPLEHRLKDREEVALLLPAAGG